MKLIVGLGNPGKKYQHTLHNVGFSALDVLANKLSLMNWTNRFKGLIHRGNVEGQQFILLKPQTFMNVSGESVLACKQFFKIDLSDILILSDDIDRPAGLLRYRSSGGHGGHNGLRNIIQLLGANQFHRLKIGIGRPVTKQSVAKYVLSTPSADIQQSVEDAVKNSVIYQLDFLKDVPIQIQP